jgi:hypothetical protein
VRMILVFIIGVVAGLSSTYWAPSPLNAGLGHSGIIVRIVDDAAHLKHSVVVLQINDGRQFTCTLHRQACSFLIEGGGDVGFSVSAIDDSGTIYRHAMAHEYYGEPGTTHSVLLSTLSGPNT